MISPQRQALIFLSASACSLSSCRARCGLPARIAPKRRPENLAKKSGFAPAIHRWRWFCNTARGCPLVGRPEQKMLKTWNCGSARFCRGRCAPHSGQCSTRRPRCAKSETFVPKIFVPPPYREDLHPTLITRKSSGIWRIIIRSAKGFERKMNGGFTSITDLVINIF